ncbi:MAG: low molecular weight phosphatase family protein [Aquificae bacterium]|nr:low molecular weight phosphatase family protein [Aquificota bacterium]
MKIGFISRKGAVRALMAESIARKILQNIGIKAEVFSAGLEPERTTDSKVLEVLKEKGYPTRGLYPKPIRKIPFKKLDMLVILDNEIKEKVEFVITHKRRENVPIEPPRSETITEYRRVRDEIERELKELFGLEKEQRRKGA